MLAASWAVKLDSGQVPGVLAGVGVTDVDDSMPVCVS